MRKIWQSISHWHIWECPVCFFGVSLLALAIVGGVVIPIYLIVMR